MGMSTDMKNGYAVGLQTGIELYEEVVKTYSEGDIDTVDAPSIEMVESAQAIDTVDAPSVTMVCIISEAEYVDE